MKKGPSGVPTPRMGQPHQTRDQKVGRFGSGLWNHFS